MSPTRAWAQGSDSAPSSLAGTPVREPSPAERATARKLAEDAFFALSRGDYREAVDYYARALVLVHAPTLLRDLARAQVGLGLLVEAHENYSEILREGVADDAPEPFLEALEDAQREIEPLSARLSWVTLSATGAPASELRVSIDGQFISAATLDVKRAINPGRHEIRAVAPGYEPVVKTLVIQESESVELSLAVQHHGAPGGAEAALRAQAPAGSEQPRWRAPVTIGAFALGGAGVALGSVAGILALKKHDQLARACPGSVCDPSLTSERSDYRRWGLMSTVGFAAGGIGLAGGMVLLLVKPAQPQADRSERSSLVVAPYLGLSDGGLKGTF